MVMTETGHNTYEWIQSMTATMEQYNIGYTYWPYKKMGNSSWVGFDEPDGWEAVREYAEAPRGSYAEMREIRPNATAAREAIMQYAENCKWSTCKVDSAYIRAMGLQL